MRTDGTSKRLFTILCIVSALATSAHSPSVSAQSCRNLFAGERARESARVQASKLFEEIYKDRRKALLLADAFEQERRVVIAQRSHALVINRSNT